MNTYPPDIIPILQAKWDEWKTRLRPGDVPPLPSTSEVEILLDVAFHSTFLTEEGRRPGFRLVYYSSKDYDKDSENPYRRRSTRLVPLDIPRPYTSAEVNRLAPAAELTRMLICTDNISNDPQKPDFVIWALLDVGENWWKMIRGEAISAFPPPSHLTISSSSPGELSLSVGGRVFMALRNGQILYPLGNVSTTGPVAGFFKSAKDHLYNDTLASLHRKKWDPQNIDEDYPLKFYDRFLERILFHIRERQHGGMVIIIPQSIDKTDTRITDRLMIKYSCSYDYIWDLLVSGLANDHKYYNLLDQFYDAKKNLTTAQFRKYYLLTDEKQELSEALRDAAQAVAALTSVDGAVVMTDHFHILGFGAEVIAPSPSLKEIVISVEPKHIRAPIESYGTRHRAAFRFCSSFENCVAFVVSRDGGVKAVKRVASDVILWPDINAGAIGL
jgi:hypothetical protein